MHFLTLRIPQKFKSKCQTGVKGPWWLRAAVCLVLVLDFGERPVRAQDLNFSQFPSLPMGVNPALAGNAGHGQLSLIFRDQWPEFPQTYVSYALAWDQFFPRINSAFGAMALGDRQGNGVFNTHSLHAFYVYGVPLGQHSAIRLGMEFSWAQRGLRWEELRFFDQIDPVFGFNNAAGVLNPTGEIPPGDPSIHWFNAGTGAMIFNRKLYAGLSLKNLPRPNTAFYEGREDRIPLSWSLQAGARLPIGDNRRDPTVFSPYVLGLRQGDFSQARAGMRLGKGLVYAGTAFRYAFSPLGGNADALIAEAGLRKNGFEMTYSYDLSLGPTAGQGGGAHEIALLLRLTGEGARETGRQRSESLRCPVF